MANIDLLLESLDSQLEQNEPNEEDFPANPTNDSHLDKSSHDSFEDDDSLPKDPEFEKVKRSLSKKYSDYGYEIHKQLKEKTRSSYDDHRVSTTTWKSQSSENSKQGALSAPQTVVKQDVYAEPIFGLRLINPTISSQLIQAKMVGRTPITLAKMADHLSCGDKNSDWVFAGAVVFKSGLRTSQKGSQYCLWKISDLKHDLKQVTVYLFSKAGSELWKLALGSVVAILNPSVMNKDEAISKDDITLSVRNPDQVMLWGTSRDYGICKARKKNGENCTSFVNKSACEFCLYHVKSEYNKYTGKRFDLQASYSNGLTELRNKVLGKSEVFYGGKSFTALKPPPKNNKHREKDHSILNNLSTNKQATELFRNNSKNQNSDHKTLEKLNEKVSISDIKPKNEDKPIVSARMSVLKEAGKKLIQTGEVTRITAVNLEKRKAFVSFADMFSPDNCLPDKVTKKPSNDKISSPKINKKPASKVNSSTQKTAGPITLKPCTEIIFDFDEPINKKIEPMKSGDSPRPSTCRISNKKTECNSPLPSKKQSSQKIDTSNSLSKVESQKQSVPSTIPQSLVGHDDAEDGNNLLKSRMQSLMQRSRASDSIHKKKLDQAKMNAIRLVKRNGGLSKTNPNQIKPKTDEKRTAAVKRALESNDEEDNTELSETKSLKKSILSERFIELMNAQSKHENLVQLAADMEEQNYFNKMEKKEQLEEKMLTTYKVPCKAVSCLKCKYKWFSASDLCKAEGHPIKVIDAVKRFFKCQNCSNRSVTLDIVPLICCKQCGSSNWTRAPMIREKICQSNSNLSIRGDESTFIDSFTQKQNLNLLVPE